MANTKANIIAVIAIIAIGVSIYFIAKRGTSDDRGKKEELRSVYLCVECGHQFKVNPRDAKKLRMENPEHTGMIKCPKCGKFSAAPAVRCPHCLKFFVPSQSRAIYGPGPIRCPHCGKTGSGEP